MTFPLSPTLWSHMTALVFACQLSGVRIVLSAGLWDGGFQPQPLDTEWAADRAITPIIVGSHLFVLGRYQGATV